MRAAVRILPGRAKDSSALIWYLDDVANARPRATTKAVPNALDISWTSGSRKVVSEEVCGWPIPAYHDSAHMRILSGGISEVV
jgi:hypothetical protein